MTVSLSAQQIIAHRGVPSLAPENTLGGFHKAAELGAQWVELDVSLLGDGTPMVIHDATIDRCSDHQGFLDQMTLADLAPVNNAALYPQWQHEPVPTLQEVLAVLNQYDMGLNLELKDHGLPIEPLVKQTIDTLQQDFPHLDRLIISSFNLDILDACQAYAPEIRLGLLYNKLSKHWQVHAKQLQAYSIHINWRHLTYKQAHKIKKEGYQLIVYTANQPLEMESFWHWGLDAVITDCPQSFLTHYNL